ncbi:MAG: serine protease [Planctomycetota bacterium]
MARASLLALLLLLLLPSLTGCSVFLEGASLDEKRASLLAHPEHTLGGSSPRTYVRERIALLVQGTFLPDGAFAIESNGTAVAVSADGYFLTAGHCVEGDRPLFLAPAPLIAFDAEALLPARVVWRAPDCDLALVHAPLRSAAYVQDWPRAPRAGAAVLVGGFPGKAYAVLSAGAVLEVRHCACEGAVVEVHHDAPVRRGDSGGPVFDAEGVFLGINVEGIYHWPWLELTAKALLPDAESLQARIEADRWVAWRRLR